MCLRTSRQDLFNEQTFDASEQFADVFSQLLEARSFCGVFDGAYGCSLCSIEEKENDLSARLQQLLRKDNQRLLNLPRHETYSRHVIGVEDDWVAYICRWEKSTTSCIHGHPWFAYYQVIDGALNMELYEPCDEHVDSKQAAADAEAEPLDCMPTVKHVQSKCMQPGDVVWREGKPDSYDNLIHRVSTDEQPGFTLHLFSENPALGEHFRVVGD